jgi:nicotinamidase-related amidase
MPDDKYRMRGHDMMLEATSVLERPPLQPAKTAVVVIDMLNRCCVEGVGMLRSMAASGVLLDYYLARVHQETIPRLNELLGACRSMGVRVVFVNGGCYTHDFADCIPQFRVNYREWNARVGTYEMELVPGLIQEPEDVTFIKAGSGGFASTLDVRLRNMGIEQIIYTGVVTNGCVLLTLTAGFDHGYHGWLVSDATASFSQRLQDITEELVSGYMARVVSTSEMIGLVTGAAPAPRAAARPQMVS